MKLLYILFVLCLVYNVLGGNQRVDPLVRIEQGLVRGLKASDGDYSAFLGIPYAQVDLDNPFGAAQPHPGFVEDIYSAYDGSIRCPQSDILPLKSLKSYNETIDCLRLNIYVPSQASSHNPLPVLVWIHGGVFVIGAAGEFHPRDLVRHGIIVVTINYRLGPYGFMCLDVPTVPGNQGLKDQLEALRWVRNNIAAFGGNPYNVTLSGHSAGSSSALLHLYSSKEKLYHRVIAESGTPQTERLFVEGDVTTAVQIAEYLGFNTTDTQQALDFLASTSSNLVTAAASDLNLVLRPCKERSFSSIDNFIEDDLFSLSNERKIRSTPILIGQTSKELVDMLPTLYGDNYFKSDPFYKKLKDNFNLDEEELVEAASTVRHFYIGDEPVSTSLKSELEDFESDFMFNHPMQRTITNLLKENADPVYEYMYSYVPNGAPGAGHTSELSYLFQLPYTVYDEDQQLIADRITTLWANFVKYGNPTPEATELLPVIWEPSSAAIRPYLVIDTDMRLEHRVYKDRMAFWDLFYYIYGKKHNLMRKCSEK